MVPSPLLNPPNSPSPLPHRTDKAVGKTLTLSGPKAWSTREVIEMCEDLSNSTAKVTTVPTAVLKFTRALLKSCSWAADAADRLVGRGGGRRGHQTGWWVGGGRGQQDW